VLPIVDSLGLSGPAVLQLLPQIAIADAACVVALPLAIDPARAGTAAAGSAAVLGCAAAAFGVLWLAQRRGWRRTAHRKSERRGFALELRVSLLILLLLATLAQRVHVSILLAGFSLGVAVAAIGEPRRLARQLFGLTEGLFGPVFFVWLGASLDLRDLGRHSAMIGLGVALAAAALLAHTTTVITRQPVPLAALSCAQLGVPVAAATIGQQLHLLRPGEPAALLLAAMLTVAAASLGARRAVQPASQAQDGA
jgi:Kef-type K+ transport system membrane component KefB